MKKAFLVAGALLTLAIAAHAQSKKQPPPPPPPPTPPVEMTNDVPPPPPPPPAPPVKDEEKTTHPKDYQDFLDRNPSVKSVGWNFRNEVIVYLKSGKEERYKLDEEGRKEAEAKYGKLPVPPPPPPIPPKPPVAPKPPVPPRPED